MIWQESEGCDTSRGVPSDCAEVRGGAINNATSSTFEVIGAYNIQLNQPLGYSGAAEYGNPSVPRIYVRVLIALQASIRLDFHIRIVRV